MVWSGTNGQSFGEKEACFFFGRQGRTETVLTEENDLPKQDQQTRLGQGLMRLGKLWTVWLVRCSVTAT